MGRAQAQPLFLLLLTGPPGAASTARAQRDGTPQDARLPADAPPPADLHSLSAGPKRLTGRLARRTQRAHAPRQAQSSC